MARAQGYNVWGEYYPYIQGSTGVSADFLQPKLWLDKYHYEYKDTLYDPTTDSFIPDRTTRITSYNVCYTKLLRSVVGS